MRPVVFSANFIVAETDTEVLLESSDIAVKLRFLLRELEKQKTRSIIPTPVLAEIMVKKLSGRARLIQLLQRSSRFQPAEFDPAAAVAAVELMAAKWPRPKDRNAEWSRHRLKFDLQILPMAQVNNVGTFYTSEPLAKPIGPVREFLSRISN